MTRFRYSPTKFWVAFVVALGLTAMVTGLVWMIFTRLGNPNTNTITAVAGFIFLAFFSARMGLQYFRNEVVLAIMPTGLKDSRWGIDLVPWNMIKEITLHQHELNFALEVHIWANANQVTTLPIDLASLEGDVDDVITAIAKYMSVQQSI